MAGEVILIVEDDEHIGAALRRALQAEHYKVSWEPTGRRATAAVRVGGPISCSSTSDSLTSTAWKYAD